MKEKETVSIEKDYLIAQYKAASNEGRKLLENIYGKDVVKSSPIDRIDLFEDACTEVGIDCYVFEDSIKDLPEDEQNYKRLKIIVKAYNEGEKPDFSNESKPKYYPCFKVKELSGFSYNGYGYSYARPSVGSQLCFLNLESMKDAVEKFLPIFEGYLL